MTVFQIGDGLQTRIFGVEISGEYEFEVGPFAELNLGVALQAGCPGPFCYIAGNFKFLGAEVFAGLNSSTSNPVVKDEPGYKGPDWQVPFRVTGGLKPLIETLDDAIDNFFKVIDEDLAEELGGLVDIIPEEFFKIDDSLAASPQLELSTEWDPKSNGIRVGAARYKGTYLSEGNEAKVVAYESNGAKHDLGSITSTRLTVPWPDKLLPSGTEVKQYRVKMFQKAQILGILGDILPYASEEVELELPLTRDLSTGEDVSMITEFWNTSESNIQASKPVLIDGILSLLRYPPMLMDLIIDGISTNLENGLTSVSSSAILYDSMPPTFTGSQAINMFMDEIAANQGKPSELIAGLGESTFQEIVTDSQALRIDSCNTSSVAGGQGREDRLFYTGKGKCLSLNFQAYQIPDRFTVAYTKSDGSNQVLYDSGYVGDPVGFAWEDGFMCEPGWDYNTEIVPHNFTTGFPESNDDVFLNKVIINKPEDVENVVVSVHGPCYDTEWVFLLGCASDTC